MPLPKEVFDDPVAHWSFLTINNDSDFEGQHFDRKEACRPDGNGAVSSNHLTRLRDQVVECVSAFANSNTDGGLLVIGIVSDGTVAGTSHLNENQMNNLTNIDEKLVGQSAHVKLVECTDVNHNANHICLIHVPYSRNAICETIGRSRRAWERRGPQNLQLDDSGKDRIRRDKQIVEFERTTCCPFDPSDIDLEVLEQFREVFLDGATYEYSDEEVLYRAGAVTRQDGQSFFTNAGYLFFAKTPQRIFPNAIVRVLNYEAPCEDQPTASLITFDKDFTGSITKQIRDIRGFIKNSLFFKTYQKRKPDGGFNEEQELPSIAVDEAIVNALAHRDYAINASISFAHYKDCLVVSNPGRLQQNTTDLPDNFSLENEQLETLPRNALIMDWLRKMKDSDGSEFVRALAEGTRIMRDEMAKNSLPAPEYTLTSVRTAVRLYNNIEEREAKITAGATIAVTEYANLFPVTIKSKTDEKRNGNDTRNLKKEFMRSLRSAMESKGWFFDRTGYSRLIAHRKGERIRISQYVDEIIGFYPAFSFQLREYRGNYYLGIDYTLEVKNLLRLDQVKSDVSADSLISRRVIAKWNDDWQPGKIIGFIDDNVQVDFFDFEQQDTISSINVIPDLSISQIKILLRKAGLSIDLSKIIKTHSLASKVGAARVRWDKISFTAKSVARDIFPLNAPSFTASMSSTPQKLSRQLSGDSKLPIRSLQEPVVEFARSKETADIREGITQYGAYDTTRKDIEIVPLCLENYREQMASLIQRLQSGKFKYHGAERTFHTRLTYNAIVTVPAVSDLFIESKRIIDEHPDWHGNSQNDRIFLVHTPEAGFASDDESSPYYTIKRLLLEKGVPCQMVDTPTLNNPDFKDLNLALNIVAKCGITPWVLPEALGEADFFIGLSYTQDRRGKDSRLLGYANVFDNYGKWSFYSGGSDTFAYDKRAEHFSELTSKTLGKLQLTDTPSVYFHYSSKFSRQDRDAILKAARNVKPNGTYSFVWLNKHHNVRLFDNRAETDGSIARGSYVISSPSQIYLSTTGFNPYRKVLGTPKILEANIWIYPPAHKARAEADLHTLAVQLLSLTKLNWASTDALCGEPITTKYAGDIAYLTAAFMRQGQAFTLHPELEKTPWFI